MNSNEGRILIAIISILIFSFLSFAIYIFRPSQIEFNAQAGTVIVKSGSKQNSIFMLSSSGTREQGEPWTETGVEVRKNDKIKITASGRVHTALNKLITISQTDKKIQPSWVGPNGSSTHQESDWDKIEARNGKKLLPDEGGAHYGYGMLIAAIRDSQNKVKRNEIEPIGSEREFTARKNGRLVFAVNDILLDEKAKDTYALPPDQYPEYYEDKLNNDPLFEDLKKSNMPREEKIRSIYNDRMIVWKKIKEKNNYMVWYDDNIGSFSVSIAVN